MEATDEGLKQQFNALQIQQQKKLTRLKEHKEKEDKNSSNSRMPSAVSQAFGVDDELDLKLADPPSNGSAYSEELVVHLNNQLREMKDEAGRLYKLLSERDLQLRQLKKKRDQDRELLETGTGGVSSEAAATKIVELSKKIRELTAEVETERTKARQQARKCADLERKLSEANVNPAKTSAGISYRSEDNSVVNIEEFKALQEKLKQAEMKVSEHRNQSQTLRQELKMANKVLAQEVGENVSVQSLASGSGGWRGRAQQIISLQKKVNELRSQIEDSRSQATERDLESEFMGSSTYRKPNPEERGKEQIRKMEKDRKENQEKLQAEMKALEKDNEALKNKIEASKARNKVLSNDLRAAKQQLSTLLEKGKHDDELIEVLLKQQQQLKSAVEEKTKERKQSADQKHKALSKQSSQAQQETNIVEQLKNIVTEKERKVKDLEQEIEQLRLTNLQKAQLQGVGDLFERSASRPLSGGSRPATGGSRPTSGGSRPTSVIAEVMDHDVAPSPQPSLSSRPGTRAMSNKPSTRPASQNTGVAQSVLDDLQLQCHEYQCLSQAASVERDRLTQLINVLEQRISESTLKATEIQTELMAERRKNVELEKRLGKAKVEQNQSAKKSKMKSPSVVSLRDSVAADSLQQSTVEELEVRLDIQMDENKSLKAALQSTLKAKEEDMKLYQEMMQETKKVFLEGLRQFRLQQPS